MDSRLKKVQATIEILKGYMQEYHVSFESAIQDWDEPWTYDYLYDVLVEHYGNEPLPDIVCSLAGVNPKFWQDFRKGA